MSLQDLPAITVERLEGGARGVRVEVVGVAPVTYTTEAALALADKAVSFGDNKPRRRAQSGGRGSPLANGLSLTERRPVARISGRRVGGWPRAILRL